MARSSTSSSKVRRQGGFTLLEEPMIVVFIIGILGSLALPMLSRYVKKSRTAEAATHLQKLWGGAIAYYETDHASASGAPLAKQFPGTNVTSMEPECCAQTGARCQGNSSVYNEEPWKSLAFNISDAHLYRPVFWATPDPTRNMWAESWGDLDCDGIFAKFIRKADVTSNGDVQGYIIPAGVNELE